MKPFLGILFLAALASAQPPAQLRETQQEAYRNWRQTDPTLERDAATAGPTLGARADKAAAAAARYFTTQKAYMENLAADAGQEASTLEAVTLTPDAAALNVEAFVTGETTRLASSVETIARDPDRGIQQLRLALQRERTALAAVDAVLKNLQGIQQTVAQSSNSAEQARTQTVEHYQKLAASFRQSAQLADQLGTAWANYYRALSDGARSVAAPATSAAPATTAAPVGVSAAAEPAPASVANPAPAAANRSVTPVPLSRYVGAWTYPTVGAHYHGAQPEFVDLVVHEENGRASGTLYARFKLPPGSAGDPLVRFDFAGDFQPSRGQKFAATASSGAKGTMELIPGPAFNLLEVNFAIDDKPGTVRQANFLLIKK